MRRIHNEAISAEDIILMTKDLQDEHFKVKTANIMEQKVYR